LEFGCISGFFVSDNGWSMVRFTKRMDASAETEAMEFIKEKSYPLEILEDLDPLFEKIGDGRIVMLGEASHGTHEYYAWRIYITQRLIREKAFNFIAVEGDWPDCYG
jgi:erythromycin esterase-like protein